MLKLENNIQKILFGINQIYFFIDFSRISKLTKRVALFSMYLNKFHSKLYNIAFRTAYAFNLGLVAKNSRLVQEGNLFISYQSFRV